MSKDIRKLRFLDAFRIGENESYYSDMAAKGLHLKRSGTTFIYFEKNEPKNMHYRIESLFGRTMSHEQREIYTECGWEFVCEQESRNMFGWGGSFCVFRSPESDNLLEVHTDPAEQSFMLDGLNRFIKKSFFIYLITVVLIAAMIICSMFIGPKVTIRLVEGNNFAPQLLSIAAYFIGIASMNSALVSMRKMRQSLMEGRPINHRANWKKHVRYNKTVILFLLILTPVFVTLPFISLYSAKRETLPIVNDNHVILRLADIENNPSLERSKDYYEPRYEDDFDFDNYTEQKWSLLAPVQIELHERGKVPGRTWSNDDRFEYSPSITYLYYKLTFPFMAKAVIYDMAYGYSYDEHDSKSLEKIDCDWADILLIREDGSSYQVFASLGGEVVYVRYYGEREPDSVVKAVESMMKNSSRI